VSALDPSAPGLPLAGGGGGGGGGIHPGTFFPEVIALPIVGGDLEPQDGDPWFDVGAYSLTPSAHEIPGADTTTVSFTAIGQTTRSGLYGDLRLYDLTHSAVLAGMSFNGAGWSSGTGVVTMPPGAALLMVQARARAPGGVLVGDFFNLRGAHLHIVNTF